MTIKVKAMMLTAGSLALVSPAAAHAGILSAVGTWLTSSAACWALILPPAQLVCAVGAGLLTGVAAVIPTP